MKKVIRGGVRVRYVGNDALMKEIWGNMVCKVVRRSGKLAMGNYPCRYADGSIHLMSYGLSVKDLEIVN